MLFSFCLPPQWRSTFKEKNLLPQEQIVSLTRDPISEGLRHPGNLTGSHKTCLSV